MTNWKRVLSTMLVQYVQFDRRDAVVGVGRDRAAYPQYGEVQGGVRAERDLGDDVDAVRGGPADVGCRVALAVVDDVVGVGAASRALSEVLTVLITAASAHRASWITSCPTAPAPPAARTAFPSSASSRSRSRSRRGPSSATVSARCAVSVGTPGQVPMSKPASSEVGPARLGEQRLDGQAMSGERRPRVSDVALAVPDGPGPVREVRGPPAGCWANSSSPRSSPWPNYLPGVCGREPRRPQPDPVHPPRAGRTWAGRRLPTDHPTSDACSRSMRSAVASQPPPT